LKNQLCQVEGIYPQVSSNDPTPFFKRTHPQITMVFSRDQVTNGCTSPQLIRHDLPRRPKMHP
jgi:hypothetical protein